MYSALAVTPKPLLAPLELTVGADGRIGANGEVIRELDADALRGRLEQLKATGEVEALTYVIRDPLPILTELIPVVRGAADYIVLLSHMKKSELDGILDHLDGVDKVVLGHSRKQQATID